MGFIFSQGIDAIHNQGSRRQKREGPSGVYRWHLLRKLNDEKEFGTHALPTEDLGNGLTKEAVGHYLNSQPILMDHTYQAHEHDEIFVYKIALPAGKMNRWEAYMCFSYSNGQWLWSWPSDYINIEKLAAGSVDLL